MLLCGEISQIPPTLKHLETDINRKSIWLVRGILALAALLLVGWKFGFQVLDPTHDSWLYFLGSDITPDYFAWMFYRDTPWQWPLGVIENYSYPVETSVGLTGGIPLLAVPFKMLSPILPETFQYYGWWFLMNYVLQGWAGVYLLRQFKIKNTWLLLLGGAFFILSPPFLDRHPHANLTAHWILLFALGTAIASHRQIAPKKKIWIYAALTFAATWIHPYLVLFPVGFAMIDWIKTWWLERKLNHEVISNVVISKRNIFLWPLATVGALVVAYFSIGYNIMPSKGALSSGFGKFSANINTFFNSMDRMEFIPGMPLAFSDQYEGFGYLGGGMICLLILGVVLLAWKRPVIQKQTWKRLPPVGLAALGFFILALSNVVTFQEHILFEIPLNKTFERIGGTFRASGRYVWASHYLIFGLIFWVLAKRIPKAWMLIPIFAIGLIIQLFDVRPYIPSQDIYPHGPYQTPLTSEAWPTVFTDADLIVMEPAYERNFGYFGDDMYFIRLAHETKTPITAGHLARYDNEARNRMRDTIRAAQETGVVPASFRNSVFVTAPVDANRFDKLVETNAVQAYMIDGYVMFLPPTLMAKSEDVLTSYPRLSGYRETAVNFWERHSNDWVFVSVKDEASYQLCSEIKDYSKAHGGTIHNLGFRLPYLAIWHNGQVLWDSAYSETGPFTIDNKRLGDIEFPGDVTLTSGGGNDRACVIEVNGIDHAINERGLNLVAVDSSFNLLEKEWFDTYKQCGKWRIN